MSIDTPVNPSDLVRVVGEQDAAWADTGTGVLLKVVRFDTQRGTWVILNRFKPGVQLQKHRHTGSVDAYTSAGRWHYLEYDFYVTPGSYLFEPANSVHTLHVPDDNTVDTDVCFIIEGALLEPGRGWIRGVRLGRAEHLGRLLRHARGAGRSSAQRHHRLKPHSLNLNPHDHRTVLNCVCTV